MNNNDFTWLVIDPYVHIAARGDKILFYNTLSKKSLLFNPALSLAELVHEIEDPSNGYVVKVSSARLKIPEIDDFIKNLRKNFMGDLLDPSWSTEKPVNFFPRPVIKRKKKGNLSKPGDRLHEITLHLSYNISLPETFKVVDGQFIFPHSGNTGVQFGPDLLAALFNEVRSISPLTINFTGFEAGRYQYPAELLARLHGSQVRTRFFHLAEQVDSLFPDVRIKNSVTVWIVTFPFNHDQVRRILQLQGTTKHLEKAEWHFVIRSNEELESANEIIERYSLTNVFYKPLFDGTNAAFFRENIFMTEDDILNSRPDQRQVLARLSFNENESGKMTILPDGTVYASINDPPIGKTGVHSITELIEEAIFNGASWNRIRGQVAPCSDCIYHFLCPPISGYELAFKRFNLCHVKNQEPQ
jgi:pseudo-rSAM protein